MDICEVLQLFTKDEVQRNVTKHAESAIQAVMHVGHVTSGRTAKRRTSSPIATTVDEYLIESMLALVSPVGWCHLHSPMYCASWTQSAVKFS